VKRVLLVLRRDYIEMRSSAAFRIMVAIVSVITVGASVGISIALRLQAWFGVPEARPVLDLIVGLVVYFLTFSVLIAFIWAFASLPVVQEKVNGNIECLLATPISPKALWIGKVLAVFLPSYALSVIASCIVLLAVNISVAMPGWGILVLPVPALVNGLVINPLLFLALLAFIVLFSLANNPDMAIAPALLIGFGLMIGMPVGLATGIIVISSWSFVLWYFGATVIAWGVVMYLTHLLTRQNIVLSSKGG
jgi:ABC-type Na+ efflux pump permease subunit